MLYIIILLFQIIASFTHIIAKNITGDLSPDFVLLIRAALACFFYIIWMLVFRKKVKKIEKKDFLALFVIGLLNIPLNQFLFLTAVHYTTAPNVALAYALSPVFVLIIAAIFLKERVNIKKLTGVALAFGGIVLVYSEHGFDFSSNTSFGNLLVLLASLFWSFYTIIGKKFSEKYGAFYTTGLSMMTGFMLYIPVFSLMPGIIDFSIITGLNWLQLLYLGIITSGLNYGLWYWALTKTEASKLAVFNNLQPVFTTILSVFILSQGISLFFIFGGVLILSGVTITQKG
jgi:drug/metabolite transporter (DMT)-like permease